MTTQHSIWHGNEVAVFCALSLGVAADDYPQWRGPERNGLSKEKGLLQEWPVGGPKLLWQAKDIGDGVFVARALRLADIQGVVLGVALDRDRRVRVARRDVNGVRESRQLDVKRFEVLIAGAEGGARKRVERNEVAAVVVEDQLISVCAAGAAVRVGAGSGAGTAGPAGSGRGRTTRPSSTTWESHR